MPQDIAQTHMHVTIPCDFDDSFAGPAEWATLYRTLNWQVVPSFTPREQSKGGSWKRPFIAWRELQNALVPDLTFNRWYGAGGEHVSRSNMGLLTGPCSNGMFVVDLDWQRHEQARQWIDSLKVLHNNDGDFQTPTQTTGGGGRQLFFREPPGWTAPTIKTSIGIDIRGRGGFAVLPPSLHESGKSYEWVSGFEPWETDVQEAPDWLCAEIDALALQHGGGSHVPSGVTTPTPDAAYSPLGMLVDGREDYMTRIVWGAVVDLHRDAPIPPTRAESDTEMLRAFAVYETHTKSRLPDGGTNTDRLELEGRGLSLFKEKWSAAMRQWDKKVATAAAVPKPEKEGKSTFTPFDAANIELRVDPETGEVFNASTGHSAAEPAPDAPQSPTELKKRLTLIPWSDLVDEPVRWLVDGLLPAKAFAAIYGKPGSYKSFLALYIGSMVACGRPVFGKHSTAGDVVYVAGEGGAGLKRRRDALIQQHEISGSVRMHFLKAQLNLRSTDADLIAFLQEMASARITPALIIIDTLARAFAGGNENAPEDMGAFISIIGAMQEATGAAVMVVHHSGKDEAKGLRGHSSLLGAVDTELECQKTSSEESTERRGILSVTKQKDGEDGYALHFEMASIHLSQIDPTLTSLAVIPSDDMGNEGQSVRRRNLSPNDKMVLQSLRDVLDEYGESVGIRQIPVGQKVVKVGLWRSNYYMASPHEMDTKQKTFKRCVDRLMNFGMVGVRSEYCWITDA